MVAREGLDTGQITAVFDVDRGPGPHQEHSLTISVRDSSIVVTTEGIFHEWLSTGTGFIDTRFSRHVAAMLSDLKRMAQKEGRIL